MKLIRRSFIELKSTFFYICLFTAVDLVIIFFYFAYTKQSSGFSANILCLCDYIDYLCNSNLFRTVFIPIAIVSIYLMSELPQTANSIVRYKRKSELTLIQIMKSFFISLCFSLITILGAAGLGHLFTKTIYNWDCERSLFYLSHQYCVSVPLSTVFLWAVYRVFLWLTFFASILIALGTMIRKSYGVLIIFALIVSNIFDMISYYVSLNTDQNSSDSLYIALSSQITYFLIFPILIVLLIFSSLKLANKKDYITL